MRKILILIPLLFGITAAQNYDLIAYTYGSYTTSAKLYLCPDAVQSQIRNSFFGLEDFYNAGGEVRYGLSESMQLGLNLEYIRATALGRNETVYNNADHSTITIEVEDGFELIPIELTLHYLLPFSGSMFKFYMGGGVGYYYGNHIREFGSITSSTIEREAEFGMHVLVSMDFYLWSDMLTFFAMKFRDPQVDLKNRYETNGGMYKGLNIRVAQQEFNSKVNINGIIFSLGVGYRF